LLFSTSYLVDGVFVAGSRLPSGEFGAAGVLKSWFGSLTFDLGPPGYFMLKVVIACGPIIILFVSFNDVNHVRFLVCGN
jgi:hypothetical protein